MTTQHRSADAFAQLAVELHDSAGIGCGSTIAGLSTKATPGPLGRSGRTAVSAEAAGATHTASRTQARALIGRITLP